MDLQTEKIELIKLLLETDSQEIINQIKSVFEQQGYDFYDELPSHIKASIGNALKNIEEGDIYDHDMVMHDMKIKYGADN